MVRYPLGARREGCARALRYVRYADKGLRGDSTHIRNHVEAAARELFKSDRQFDLGIAGLLNTRNGTHKIRILTGIRHGSQDFNQATTVANVSVWRG